MTRIAVVIPALDEEQAIGLVVSEVRPLVAEVVVVDNGSCDRTADVARASGARVVVEPRRGYGQACLTGIAALGDTADVIVFLDGDHSDHAAQLPDLVAPILSGQADMVIGSRTRGRAAPGSHPWHAVAGTRFCVALMNLLIGTRASDLGPFRAITRTALAALDMQDRNYGWTVEMQVKARRAGLRVAEVPVDYRPRIGRSKVSGTVTGTVRAAAKILGTIVRYAVAPLRRPIVLGLCAAVLSGCVASWARTGDQTVDVQRFLATYALAFAAYLAALHWSGGLGSRALRITLGVAFLWRVVLVFTPPLLSDDVYRYVWEGRIQLHGGNPYVWEHRPEGARWAPLRDDVWRGVTHKSYSALYPPAWQMAARAAVWLHDSVTTMKAFLVACELGALALLGFLLRRRGLPPERILVLAWSPLALVEVAGSGHNDAFAILLTVAALAALETGRPVVAAVAGALALDAKILPGFIVAAWARRFRWWHVAFAGAVAAALFLPYAAAGSGLWHSAIRYARYWRFNETLFALLRAVFGVDAAVAASTALLLATVAAIAWRRAETASAGLIVVAASLLLAANVLPWYALWFLPFLVLRDSPPALLFTGTVALAYLAYPDWRSGETWHVSWWVRALEYGPCAVVAWLARPAGCAMSDRLLVFVKAPRAGAVKTRLAAVLGDDGAARLYRVLAEEEIRRTAPRAGEYDRTFFYTPEDARPEIERWLPGEMLEPQQGRDLGERMSQAFVSAFAAGARRVAIIGTDVPAAGREHVMEALRSLGDHDVVLGPTHDGGYYLIALDRPRPALFQSIPWSTPSVLSATAERAGVLGLSVRMLDPLRDIDTVDDLKAQWGRVRPLTAGTALEALVSKAIGM